MGSAECNFGYNVCVLSCGGQWCWQDGLDPPLQKSDLLSLKAPPSLDSINNTIQLTNDTDAILDEQAEEDGTKETQTETPAPTLGVPDNVQVVVIEDESFKTDGYVALVTLLLDNITVAQFTPLQQLYFRQ
eukprot:scaffold656342_cov46-Prasinocladus_malaysianus.AAC.1